MTTQKPTLRKCRWCPHAESAHSAYYGGLCAIDVTVVDDGPVPYNVSCWCGSTEDTAGPRVITSRSVTRLVQVGREWRYPHAT